MRAILAIVMMALLTVPSAAQFKPMATDRKDAEPDLGKKKKDDKDYKSALDRMPDQKFDPWRQMR